MGNNRAEFCPNAKIIRIDIDRNSFVQKLHDEQCFCIDIKLLLPALLKNKEKIKPISREWTEVCKVLKEKLLGFDDEVYTRLLFAFCEKLPDCIGITADVGQSEVWLVQQLHNKESQTVHMSAGHGAMGYSLPAAIGTYYGYKRPVFSFNGDGGVQMNIQELQFLSRESIPVHVVVINNESLGMIRGFQEENFDKNYEQTIVGHGYSTPNFSDLAKAYGLQYIRIVKEQDISGLLTLDIDKPSIIEIVIQKETLLHPNFGRNGLIQDQRPYMDRKLFEELMNL